MLIRDSGVVQLFAENAQEAYDLMVMAPRIAEDPRVLLPVLVCLDGFTITHSAEPVSLLADDEVARFVGPYRVPNDVLDTTRPTTQGPFAMPDYYFELRRQQAAALEAALGVFHDVAADFELLSGRRPAALERYRLGGATRAIVALGSTAGTVKDVVDELRDEHEPVGLLKLVAFRPFPATAIAAALEDCALVAVLDRADSPGGTPPLHAELAAALYGSDVELTGYVYGLGGRDLHPPDVRAVFSGTAEPHVGLRGEPCLV
jgi:pyruvate ferredoxin oxidoreductase alpha subunit